MDIEPNNTKQDTLSKITKDRQRTNLFKEIEHKFIVFLVERLPSWITSDMLTGIGLFGSLITGGSFILAAYVNRYLLLLGILGFIINWFGDSLDGRLAYYRNKPRKWYGFSLDLSVDWIAIIMIGLGFMIYADGNLKLLGFGFTVLYGFAMIMTLLRYKFTDKYSIDSGLFGPTEVRIIISLVLILEILLEDSILYSGAVICIALLIIDIIDFIKLLKIADEKDKQEKQERELHGKQ